MAAAQFGGLGEESAVCVYVRVRVGVSVRECVIRRRLKAAAQFGRPREESAVCARVCVWVFGGGCRQRLKFGGRVRSRRGV